MEPLTHATSPRAESGLVQLSLVLPVYNQRTTLRARLHEAETALRSLDGAYEILVVDDGSTDETAAEVRAVAQTLPQVRFLQHDQPAGREAAWRSGCRAATGRVVAVATADSGCELSALAYMLPMLERFDLVCGYRVGRQDAPLQRLASWTWNTCCQALLASPVRDVNCPLKLFRRDHAEVLLPADSAGPLPLEMLSRAGAQGLSVVEVGGPCAEPEARTTWWRAPHCLAGLLRVWWQRVLFPAPPRLTAVGGGSFWLSLLALALLALVLLLPNLSYPLIKPDEDRHARIGLEMYQSGNWISPTWRHQPYYNKPPLFYWLGAICYTVFGTQEWVARLPSVAAALLTVLGTFAFGWRIVGPRAAFLGAALLVLTPSFIQCGRFVILDSVFSLLVCGSLFVAYEAVQGPRFRRGWWFASALICGLALLTKGPVALVLLAPPVLLYCLLNAAPGRPPLTAWLLYGLIALLVAAPWYGAVIYRDSGFAYQFFIDQNLRRFFLAEHHPNHWWYYVPVLLIAMFPWSFLLYPLGRFLISRAATTPTLRPPALGFLLLWFSWCLGFFSLSSGKLPPYILPAVPPLALLLGYYLNQAVGRATTWTAWLHNPVWAPRHVLVSLAGTWLVTASYGWQRKLVPSSEFVVEAGVCLLVLVIVGFWGRRLPVVLTGLLCGLGVPAIIHETAHELVPALALQRAPFATCAELRALLQDRTTVLAALDYERCSLPLDLVQSDIPSFSGKPLAELRCYLADHARTLLVVKAATNPAALARVLPASRQITRVYDGGEARVFVIEPPAYGEPAVAAGPQ